MTMESGAEVESLHKTIYQGEGTEISLMDKLPKKKPAGKSTDRIFWKRYLGLWRQRMEVDLYAVFSQNMTQMEIAHELGVSQYRYPEWKRGSCAVCRNPQRK